MWTVEQITPWKSCPAMAPVTPSCPAWWALSLWPSSLESPGCQRWRCCFFWGCCMSQYWSSVAFAGLQGEVYSRLNKQPQHTHKQALCVSAIWTTMLSLYPNFKRLNCKCCGNHLDNKGNGQLWTLCLFDPENLEYCWCCMSWDVCTWRSHCLSSAHTFFHFPLFEEAHMLISSKPEALKDYVGWMMDCTDSVPMDLANFIDANLKCFFLLGE